MPRRKKSNAGQVVNYLMDDEFRVEVQREGWEKVAGYLMNVDLPDFSGGNMLQLTFWESKDLDVLTFFTDWVVKKESHDIVIWVGSGKRGLLFSGCSVGNMYMDDLNVYDKKDEDYRGKVRVAVELNYVGVFIIDKEKAEKCAIG